MTKKIIQKVCGFVVSAAMALGSIAARLQRYGLRRVQHWRELVQRKMFSR